MSILGRLGLPAAAAARPTTPAAPPAPLTPQDVAARFGKPPVRMSADLARVLGLPRRKLADSYSPAEYAALEDRLRGPNAGMKCICRTFDPPRACPDHLRQVQRWALLEAARCGGLLGLIGVGHGKTLIDLLLPLVVPGCKDAVLLVQPSLIPQLRSDWDFYGGHWKLPNLGGGRMFTAGRPVLHIVSYAKLSNQEGTDLLTRIKPDLIICDEVQNLKDPSSARTIRFLRYFKAHPTTRLVGLSGSMVGRSIKDFAHIAERALKVLSPLPLHHPTVEEWALALDRGTLVAPPGELARFADAVERCETQPEARRIFQRRLSETPGVVVTEGELPPIALTIRVRNPGPLPLEVRTAISTAHLGERPDGEQFQEELQAVQCARQLACCFFHRWRYPRGEPPELILKWFEKRQAWNREVREMLKRPREHLDSPGLLENAARRAYQRPPYQGPLPVWNSETWPEWQDWRDAVFHETETVWLSDFVVQDAARWALESPGIVWVEFPELGERIARVARIPYFGGGPDASREILKETGARSIVASIKAHATGKNLQAFRRNLVANPPADGGLWEQLLGRTHREGQTAKLVEVEVYAHTQDYAGALQKAREYAAFTEQTSGNLQRLMAARWV